MKTLTIISAISLALIITGVNAGFAKQNDKSGNPRPTPTSVVKYQVAVNLEVVEQLCNSYQVEILDANGRLVAPPQLFAPETKFYNFEEQTRQTAGIRIARLVVVIYGPEHYVCKQELYTTPDVRLIHFKNGQGYSFDLYPTPQKPK